MTTAVPSSLRSAVSTVCKRGSPVTQENEERHDGEDAGRSAQHEPKREDDHHHDFFSHT